jgi:hypothetical protein
MTSKLPTSGKLALRLIWAKRVWNAGGERAIGRVRGQYRVAQEIEVLVLAEKVRLVGGEQIYHQLSFIGIVAVGDVTVVLAESVEPVVLEALGQSPDQQHLHRCRPAGADFPCPRGRRARSCATSCRPRSKPMPTSPPPSRIAIDDDNSPWIPPTENKPLSSRNAGNGDANRGGIVHQQYRFHGHPSQMKSADVRRKTKQLRYRS